MSEPATKVDSEGKCGGKSHSEGKCGEGKCGGSTRWQW